MAEQSQHMAEQSQHMAEQSQHRDLERLWEEHIRHEFSTRSTDDTLKTMVEDAYVDHVPVLTGGFGQAELRQFYATHFIPKMPPDMENDAGFKDRRNRSTWAR
jgi:hypothetical protein